MSDYIEDEPFGALDGADVDTDDAVTEGFDRCFYRKIGDDRWAVIDLTFFFAQEARKEGEPEPPVTFACEMEFSVVEGPDHNSNEPVQTEGHYVTGDTYDGDLSDEAARAICNAFNPAALTWDGTFPVPADCLRV